jgi:branched-subunit amino acid ABC-type transport system permease component
MIAFALGVALGAVAGVLVARNNKAKVDETVAKAESAVKNLQK